MSHLSTFGGASVVSHSEDAKKIMESLQNKGYFKELRDVWKLAAALGIARGETYEDDNRGTFVTLTTIDKDEYFGALILGLYPDLSPEERFKKFMNHFEWGIRELERREKNGTLDFQELAKSNKNTKKD